MSVRGQALAQWLRRILGLRVVRFEGPLIGDHLRPAAEMRFVRMVDRDSPGDEDGEEYAVDLLSAVSASKKRYSENLQKLDSVLKGAANSLARENSAWRQLKAEALGKDDQTGVSRWTIIVW